MTRNQLMLQQNIETKRANQAREVETNRHNSVTEVEQNRHNVETEKLGWSTLAEQIRHAQQTEQLGFANLAETNRANLAKESISRAQVALGYANLGLGYQQLSELNRHQLVTEQNEAQRTIYSGVQTANQAHHFAEQEEMWRQQTQEQHRHNVASENIEYTNIAARTVTSALEALLGAAKTSSSQKRRLR